MGRFDNWYVLRNVCWIQIFVFRIRTVSLDNI